MNRKFYASIILNLVLVVLVLVLIMPFARQPSSTTSCSNEDSRLVRSTTQDVLISLEHEDLARAKEFINMNTPTKEANDVDKLLHDVAEGLRGVWSIESIVCNPSMPGEAFAVVLFESSSGSSDGNLEYVRLHNFGADEGPDWKILLDNHSLFTGFVWRAR